MDKLLTAAPEAFKKATKGRKVFIYFMYERPMGKAFNHAKADWMEVTAAQVVELCRYRKLDKIEYTVIERSTSVFIERLY